MPTSSNQTTSGWTAQELANYTGKPVAGINPQPVQPIPGTGTPTTYSNVLVGQPSQEHVPGSYNPTPEERVILARQVTPKPTQSEMQARVAIGLDPLTLAQRTAGYSVSYNATATLGIGFQGTSNSMYPPSPSFVENQSQANVSASFIPPPKAGPNYVPLNITIPTSAIMEMTPSEAASRGVENALGQFYAAKYGSLSSLKESRIVSPITLISVKSNQPSLILPSIGTQTSAITGNFEDILIMNMSPQQAASYGVSKAVSDFYAQKLAEANVEQMLKPYSERSTTPAGIVQSYLGTGFGASTLDAMVAGMANKRSWAEIMKSGQQSVAFGQMAFEQHPYRVIGGAALTLGLMATASGAAPMILKDIGMGLGINLLGYQAIQTVQNPTFMNVGFTLAGGLGLGGQITENLRETYGYYQTGKKAIQLSSPIPPELPSIRNVIGVGRALKEATIAEMISRPELYSSIRGELIASPRLLADVVIKGIESDVIMRNQAEFGGYSKNLIGVRGSEIRMEEFAPSFNPKTGIRPGGIDVTIYRNVVSDSYYSLQEFTGKNEGLLTTVKSAGRVIPSSHWLNTEDIVFTGRTILKEFTPEQLSKLGIENVPENMRTSLFESAALGQFPSGEETLAIQRGLIKSTDIADILEGNKVEFPSGKGYRVGAGKQYMIRGIATSGRLEVPVKFGETQTVYERIGTSDIGLTKEAAPKGELITAKRNPVVSLTDVNVASKLVSEKVLDVASKIKTPKASVSSLLKTKPSSSIGFVTGGVVAGTAYGFDSSGFESLGSFLSPTTEPPGRFSTSKSQEEAIYIHPEITNQINSQLSSLSQTLGQSQNQMSASLEKQSQRQGLASALGLSLNQNLGQNLNQALRLGQSQEQQQQQLQLQLQQQLQQQMQQTTQTMVSPITSTPNPAIDFPFPIITPPTPPPSKKKNSNFIGGGLFRAFTKRFGKIIPASKIVSTPIEAKNIGIQKTARDLSRTVIVKNLATNTIVPLETISGYRRSKGYPGAIVETNALSSYTEVGEIQSYRAIAEKEKIPKAKSRVVNRNYAYVPISNTAVKQIPKTIRFSNTVYSEPRRSRNKPIQTRQPEQPRNASIFGRLLSGMVSPQKKSKNRRSQIRTNIGRYLRNISS